MPARCATDSAAYLRRRWAFLIFSPAPARRRDKRGRIGGIERGIMSHIVPRTSNNCPRYNSLISLVASVSISLAEYEDDRSPRSSPALAVTLDGRAVHSCRCLVRQFGSLAIYHPGPGCGVSLRTINDHGLVLMRGGFLQKSAQISHHRPVLVLEGERK